MHCKGLSKDAQRQKRFTQNSPPHYRRTSLGRKWVNILGHYPSKTALSIKINPTTFQFRTGCHFPDFFPIINLATPTRAARLTRQKEKGIRRLRRAYLSSAKDTRGFTSFLQEVAEEAFMLK